MSQNRNVRQSGNRQKAQAKFNMNMQKKLVVLFMLILLAFLGLAGRLVYITETKGEEYTKNVLSQQKYQSTTLPYKRGDILDSKGTKLAISEKVYNLIIDCKAVLEKEEYLEPTLEALSKCFPEINRNDIQKYIKENPSRRYYVVKKQLTYDEIKDFKGPFSDSKLRVYNTLKTMTLGYITGRYKQETDFFYNSFMN